MSSKKFSDLPQNTGTRTPKNFTWRTLAGEEIDAARVVDLVDKLNEEINYRNSFYRPTNGRLLTFDIIEKSQIKPDNVVYADSYEKAVSFLKYVLQVDGQSQISPAIRNAIITAGNINLLQDALKQVSASCICDCNFCSCDCNYCRCDCNYCRCDCNYCRCDCNYCRCNGQCSCHSYVKPCSDCSCHSYVKPCTSHCPSHCATHCAGHCATHCAAHNPCPSHCATHCAKCNDIPPPPCACNVHKPYCGCDGYKPKCRYDYTDCRWHNACPSHNSCDSNCGSDGG